MIHNISPKMLCSYALTPSYVHGSGHEGSISLHEFCFTYFVCSSTFVIHFMSLVESTSKNGLKHELGPLLCFIKERFGSIHKMSMPDGNAKFVRPPTCL